MFHNSQTSMMTGYDEFSLQSFESAWYDGFKSAYCHSPTQVYNVCDASYSFDAGSFSHENSVSDLSPINDEAEELSVPTPLMSIPALMNGMENISDADLAARINVTLVNPQQWQFEDAGFMEMIIERDGRYLNPRLSFNITGLEPFNCYNMSISFTRSTDHRWRYFNNEWHRSSKPKDVPTGEVFHGPDYKRVEGHFWMSQSFTFKAIKITNRPSVAETVQEALLLNTFHTYCPVVGIYRFNTHAQLYYLLTTKVVKEAEFIAVTAYQNPAIVKFKRDQKLVNDKRPR